MCTLITAWLVYKILSNKGEVPILVLIAANVADVVIVYFIAELVAKMIA